MVAENNSIQSSSSVETKKLDTSLSINLRPPPADRSFDDDEDSTRKPIVVKKSTVAVPSNVRVYSVADLQIATSSFSVDNLLGEGTFGRVYRAEFNNGQVFDHILILILHAVVSKKEHNIVILICFS